MVIKVIILIVATSVLFTFISGSWQQLNIKTVISTAYQHCPNKPIMLLDNTVTCLKWPTLDLPNFYGNCTSWVLHNIINSSVLKSLHSALCLCQLRLIKRLKGLKLIAQPYMTDKFNYPWAIRIVKTCLCTPTFLPSPSGARCTKLGSGIKPGYLG